VARWLGRDLRGHFTDPATVGKRCPHACCQGKRAHPAGRPVQRASAVDYYTGAAHRWASDAGVDLPFFDPDPAHDPDRHHSGADLEPARVFTEHEGHRQDEAHADFLELARSHREQRAARRKSAAGRNRALDDAYSEYIAYCDHMLKDARRATRGVMLSRAGKAAGKRDEDFFAYDARTRPGRRYMSDELRAWFGDEHTAAGVAGGRGGVLSYAAWKRQQQRKAS
jgi:hypothetical protein